MNKNISFSVSFLPVIITESEQWRLVRECHEGVGRTAQAKAMSGHFGRDKTTSLLASKVFFPKIKEKVTEFVNTCEACQRVKVGNKFDKGGETLQSVTVPREIWKQIGIDLITNLPITAQGNNTLAVVIDYTSKWVEAKPLKGKHADGIAQFLYECMCRHGAPNVVISDQGREFVNKINDRLFELCNIRHNITSAYHPQVTICTYFWSYLLWLIFGRTCIVRTKICLIYSPCMFNSMHKNINLSCFITGKW